MLRITRFKALIFTLLCGCVFISTQSFAGIDAVATPKIFDEAKKNENWKLAFLTGKDAQVVFMNVSPSTNPKNEIGMETHKFDQVIFVVEGNAKAVLNDKPSMVKSGDMIFIPQGVAHNVINLDAKKPLKIISIYSDTDIPAGAVYKKMSDAP
ncbi:MAG: cupin domain-containing protein [Gammaproteobacteria bacterium]|nr:cupin domain-containing protein [Gammaproteobacteria bacterium]